MNSSAADDDDVIVMPPNASNEDINNDIVGEDDDENVDTSSANKLNALATEQFAIKFDRHQGSVFAVACHADLVASGGEDDKAFLWNAETGALVSEFAVGFQDSISHVGFNNNGTLLFVADLVGHIQFFKVNPAASSAEKCFETDVEAEVACAEWHNASGSNVFLCGTTSGQCWIYRIPQGDCKVYQNTSPVTCFVQIGTEAKKVMLGNDAGGVCFLDLKTMSAEFEIQAQGGASSRRPDGEEAAGITCIAATTDGSMCATGTADGEVKLISIAKKQVVWNIQDIALTGSSQPSAAVNASGNTAEENGDVTMGDAETESADENLSIEAVQFGNQQATNTAQALPWLAVASIRGVVCIFDVKSRTRRHVLQLKNIAFTQMIWPRFDSASSPLILGDMDGHVVSVDSRTGELSKRFAGPESTVLGLSYSSNGRWLVAASDDGNVYVFRRT